MNRYCISHTMTLYNSIGTIVQYSYIFKWKVLNCLQFLIIIYATYNICINSLSISYSIFKIYKYTRKKIRFFNNLLSIIIILTLPILHVLPATFQTFIAVHVSRISSSLAYPKHMYCVGTLSVMPYASRPPPGVRVGLARQGGRRAQTPSRHARLDPAVRRRVVTELAEMARP